MRFRIRSVSIPITVAMLLGSEPALAASNACKSDLNGDLVVNFGDLAVLKSVFFQRCSDPGPTCGDTVAQGPTEQCDDGGLLDGDGCSSTCTIEVPLAVVCGNGIAQGPTEQCDDGNVLSGDGCSSSCTIEPPLPGNALMATGQTTCWNTAGSVISCAGTGQDGDVQAGAPLAYMDNLDGTITDVNTGLMWEKLDDDNVGGIHDWDKLYTWDNAFAVKVATLNVGGGFAGHTDWRLPNLNELESIRNLEELIPTVSPAFNTACTPGCTVTMCSCTRSANYWSSSNSKASLNKAWHVDFRIGNESREDKTAINYVRAVRGGSLRYVDNGDGTITDSNTGLMWEKLDDNNVGGIHDWDNLYTWDNAFAVKVAALNVGGGFAGHADWRLPNLNELESIRNLEEFLPAVSRVFNTACTPGCTVTSCSCTQLGNYWSSSSQAIFPFSAWWVNFSEGGDLVFGKGWNYYVRGVRGGS